MGHLHTGAENEITNKVSEQTQVNMTNVEEPLRVATKDLKVAAGKKLAERSCKNKEKLAQESKAQPDEALESESNLSYCVGAVIVIGGIRSSWLLHLRIQESR